MPPRTHAGMVACVACMHTCARRRCVQPRHLPVHRPPGEMPAWRAHVPPCQWFHPGGTGGSVPHGAGLATDQARWKAARCLHQQTWALSPCSPKDEGALGLVCTIYSITPGSADRHFMWRILTGPSRSTNGTEEGGVLSRSMCGGVTLLCSPTFARSTHAPSSICIHSHDIVVVKDSEPRVSCSCVHWAKNQVDHHHTACNAMRGPWSWLHAAERAAV